MSCCDLPSSLSALPFWSAKLVLAFTVRNSWIGNWIHSDATSVENTGVRSDLRVHLYFAYDLGDRRLRKFMAALDEARITKVFGETLDQGSEYVHHCSASQTGRGNPAQHAPRRTLQGWCPTRLAAADCRHLSNSLAAALSGGPTPNNGGSYAILKQTSEFPGT